MEDLRWEDLTPREQWKYVNQDFVRGYELLPRRHIGEIVDSTLCGVDFDDPAKLKEIVLGLYKDGKETDEIAYHVPCSIRHIQRILQEERELITIRDQILVLGNKGFTKKQILYKLKCSKNYIDQVLRESLTT